jgi:hypothetical protein
VAEGILEAWRGVARSGQVAGTRVFYIPKARRRPATSARMVSPEARPRSDRVLRKEEAVLEGGKAAKTRRQHVARSGPKRRSPE